MPKRSREAMRSRLPDVQRFMPNRRGMDHDSFQRHASEDRWSRHGAFRGCLNLMCASNQTSAKRGIPNDSK